MVWYCVGIVLILFRYCLVICWYCVILVFVCFGGKYVVRYLLGFSVVCIDHVFSMLGLYGVVWFGCGCMWGLICVVLFVIVGVDFCV